MSRLELIAKLVRIASDCRQSDDPEVQLAANPIYTLVGVLHSNIDEMKLLVEATSAFGAGALERFAKWVESGGV